MKRTSSRPSSRTYTRKATAPGNGLTTTKGLLCFDRRGVPDGAAGHHAAPLPAVGKAADAVQVTGVEVAQAAHGRRFLRRTRTGERPLAATSDARRRWRRARDEVPEATGSASGEPKEKFQGKRRAAGYEASYALVGAQAALRGRPEQRIHRGHAGPAAGSLCDEEDDGTRPRTGPGRRRRSPTRTAPANLYWVKKLEVGENFGEASFRTLDEYKAPSAVAAPSWRNERFMMGYSYNSLPDL